jgi:RNA polymerase sigma factor (TIGR02999 family)
MASGLMRGESQNHTLQPTALVNEAYMRLVSGETEWENRAHFFGAAARSMRRILVDHARAKRTQKRGGGAYRTTFEDLHVQTQDKHLDILALDQALQALSQVDPRLLKVVELRYFAGLSIQQTASLLGISSATVKRDWTFARAWLFDYMNSSQ